MKLQTLFLSAMMTLLSSTAFAGSFDGKPWGWATCADEAGTPFNLNGGYGYGDPKTVTLTHNGTTDDAAIKQAIAKYDIIIFDGSNGDFVLASKIKMDGAKNKTLVGINNARLCTEFYLTEDDIKYLKAQNLGSLSSTDQYTGTLPDGTTLTCDKRAFFTKKAMMELEHQKRGVYKLRNDAGIFELSATNQNIIFRNLSLIGPGAVDIDGADLISNTDAKNIWIDHCTFADSQDGALDSKRCDYCTYTWNKFYYTERSFSHAYTNGCGWADGKMMLHLTFGCNEWSKGCVRRLPQCGDCYVHLVNNYHNCPLNDVGITLNDNCIALVEGNYAAAGVNSPLTGSGGKRYIYARDNNYNYASTSTTVTMPYQYDRFDCNEVPAKLTGANGAGATLSNEDAMPVVEANQPSGDPTQNENVIYYFIDGLASTVNGLSTMEYADGSTLVLNKADKAWSKGTSILYKDEEVSSLKLSNGAENIFNCPEGKYAVAVTFASYFNAKDENQNFDAYPETGFRPCFWAQVGEQTFTVDEAQILKSRDGKTPDVQTFSLPGVSSFKFKNAGEQFCIVIDVTYGAADGIETVVKDAASDNAACYNLAGQRVNANAKGLIIRGGKKVFVY